MFPLIKKIKKIYKLVPEKESRVVIENALHLSTLQGINYVLPILILPYLIRIIGPEKFGLIAFAQAFTQYFMILTDYGFSVSATREISLCREQKDRVCALFSSVMTVKVILALLSTLIIIFVLWTIPRFKNDWPVYALSFGAVLGNTLFPAWFFQGTERMKYISVLNIVAGIIYALGIFICVRSPGDYLYIPLINSGVSLIAGVLGLYIVLSKFSVKFTFSSFEDIRKQLKSGWHVFSSILAINAYTTTRIFAVGLLTNNILTGYYTIAEKISGVIQTFPLVSFSQAIYPRLSHIFLKNKKKAFELMHRIQEVALSGFFISLPIIFLGAHWIARMICGADYKEVTLALRILLVSIFFVGGNAYRVQFLLVCGRANSYARIHATMALLGLPLIFLTIYYFSYLGAAVSTVIIEAGIFILTFKTLQKLSC